MARAGADVVGANCLFDPFINLTVLKKMKKRLDEEKISTFLMSQVESFYSAEIPFWCLSTSLLGLCVLMVEGMDIVTWKSFLMVGNLGVTQFYRLTFSTGTKSIDKVGGKAVGQGCLPSRGEVYWRVLWVRTLPHQSYCGGASSRERPPAWGLRQEWLWPGNYEENMWKLFWKGGMLWIISNLHKKCCLGCWDPVWHEEVLSWLLAEDGASYRQTKICCTQLCQWPRNTNGWLNRKHTYILCMFNYAFFYHVLMYFIKDNLI